ncbi:UNVERIFIED_ORG: DNA-binding MarR family transcriptional regulator [Bradyrhizobium japonicum]|uniref:MarR family winged helix-turn-helix transcriptional regulator n=1 Tax=Bradyrhizobium diazoefficiens TaxID=1355477 RepID=UPI00348BFDB1
MTHDPRDAGSGAMDLDDDVSFAVYATALAFNKAYKSLLDPLRLTYPQFLVMIVLWGRDNVTVNELGARLFLDSGTLTPLLKRLEAAGYVRRKRDPTDNRQVRITLADPGRALEPTARSAFEKFSCAIDLGAEGMTALRHALAIVRLKLRRPSDPDTRSQGEELSC